jgi:hypothetical protein
MTSSKVSGQFQAPAALGLGKDFLIFIGLEDGWAVELVWMLWEYGKISFTCRERKMFLLS